MEHQQETAYGESNRHVINDVTCVVAPICFGSISRKRLEIQIQLRWSTYSKWYMGIKWSLKNYAR